MTNKPALPQPRVIGDDADERYRAAVALVEKLRQAWVDEGEPVLALGGSTGRAPVPHPLIRMIQEAERDADRFAKAVKGRHSGPSASAVVGVAESPAARLRRAAG